MEIWIRSQDREKLIKAKDIFIKDEYERKEVRERNGIRTGAIINGKYIKTLIYVNEIYIGEYKTKERALEVMDMIHERLINLQLVSLTEPGQGKKDVNSYPYLECVFKMPKE